MSREHMNVSARARPESILHDEVGAHTILSVVSTKGANGKVVLQAVCATIMRGPRVYLLI